MVAHSSLTGADLHEVKGAAAASAGTVLSADGLGSAQFVLPSSLLSIQLGAPVTAFRSADVLPVVLDTPVTAPFDANVSDSDISINSAGTVTLTTEGVYFITFNCNFGRTAGPGTAVVAARLLLNGAQFGYTQAMSMSDATNARPAQFTIFRHFAAGDVLQVQVVRDSSGINNGGFIAIPVTPAGWGDTPSYWVRVAKILGAF